mmetsp:Transcript_24504/g.37262  ORF Transcript_24504/g.37262 Transcript_24504/m.37262 type:complete len:101 (-) Transcript_24504:655-957(-)
MAGEIRPSRLRFAIPDSDLVARYGCSAAIASTGCIQPTPTFGQSKAATLIFRQRATGFSSIAQRIRGNAFGLSDSVREACFLAIYGHTTRTERGDYFRTI